MQSSKENTCARFFSLIKLQGEDQDFYQKEIPTQVFSCAFFEIFKNTFSKKHHQATTSALHRILTLDSLSISVQIVGQKKVSHQLFLKCSTLKFLVKPNINPI